ncbi:MAG TPA: RluA family pseudouridine synthase [Anaerolineaceae bacterium]|nr:RluA family pseudouridine synthase [Anaerolineaceae bacterium]HPS32191.1 RluA family pseudouridine synthase [Anaerolineaceae bacterium]
MNAQTKELRFEQSEPERLDKFLAEVLPEHSRSQFQELIASGKVWVDGQVCLKPALKLSAGQMVSVELLAPQAQGIPAENLPLDVIYIDENTIVINKPAGLIVHPGAGHSTGTVVNAALYRWPEIRQVGEPERPGVVHRLDKETSGVLVLARTQSAYAWLVRQFKSRKTEKYYLALVDGHPPTPNGRIEAAVGRDAKFRQKMAVVYEGKGRKAVSEYFTKQSFRDHTLLEVRPFTGRTHQIRVHLAYLGCPVVGDRVYGRRKASFPLERFFLHAAKLRIILPGEKDLTEFQAALPDDLKEVLNTLSAMEDV